MPCEKCGSENIQSLEVIYLQGTQRLSARSHTGEMLNVTDSMRLTGHITHTEGSTQSLLSLSVAPPAKQSFRLAGILLAIAVFCFTGHVVAIILGVMLLIGSLTLGYLTIQYNTTKWPTLYRRWQEGRMCYECGHIFYPVSQTV